MTQPTCRLCAERLTHVLVDLGVSPLSNAYLSPEALGDAEVFYPLRAWVCSSCFLVQIPEQASPEAIFGQEYLYFSSYSSTWIAHCEAYAAMAIERFGLGARSLVVELASNDGCLLERFARRGVPVLGVEPAPNVAQVAVESRGVPTRVCFFSRDSAQALRDEGLRADLIAANNVLAHVPDLHGFLAGVRILLDDEGVFTAEFPHLMRLIEGNQFDTIYHEHYSYLSLHVVARALAEHGLEVFDVEALPTHGGSLRVYAHHAGHSDAPSPAVEALLDEEREGGYLQLGVYEDFAARVGAIKLDLLAFLIEARRAGQRVVAYGAAAKGNTLLNYCGVRRDLIEFVVDRSPHKQGHHLPGTHLPIRAPEALDAARPDVILILPWNLRDEIAQSLERTRAWGARLAVAIPQLEVW